MKETIEEAANREWGNIHKTGVLGFIEGANWQAERSFDFLNILLQKDVCSVYGIEIIEKYISELKQK